jgi:hypothetical protein
VPAAGIFFADQLITGFSPDINRSPAGVEIYNCGEGKSATFIII